MSYFKLCPRCGAALDPEEICDCVKENAAQGVTSTPDGKVESEMDHRLSASSINQIQEDFKK